MDILEKAQRMLEKYPLCDYCLGRQFALLGYGIDNKERGITIKTLLIMKGNLLTLRKEREGVALLKTLAQNGSFPMAIEVLHGMKRRTKQIKKCILCKNQFNELTSIINRIQEETEDYEYDTFLIGVRLPAEIRERQDEFQAEFESFYSEDMKNEFSRVIGKMFSQATDKLVDLKTPQVAIVISPFTDEVEVQVNALHITGRYRKLVRGISQSKWFCETVRAC